MSTLWGFFRMASIKDLLSRISPKIELPLSIHLGILGGILLLNCIGVLSVAPPIQQGIIFWVSLNLLSSPFALRARFLTPKILNPKCPYCGSYLSAIKLKCDKCGAISEFKE